MIWNRDAETASRPTMRALQTERLRATVARARARVPFYRDALAAAGVKDAAVTLDRLAELPFTVKDDLRRHYPFGLFAVPRTEVIRIHASSGTRGKPTVLGLVLGAAVVLAASWRAPARSRRRGPCRSSRGSA